MAEEERAKRRRAYVKGLITHDIRHIEGLSEEQINVHILEEYISKLNSNLASVEEFDISICETLTGAELESAMSVARKYHFDV